VPITLSFESSETRCNDPQWKYLKGYDEAFYWDLPHDYHLITPNIPNNYHKFIRKGTYLNKIKDQEQEYLQIQIQKAETELNRLKSLFENKKKSKQKKRRNIKTEEELFELDIQMSKICEQIEDMGENLTGSYYKNYITEKAIREVKNDMKSNMGKTDLGHLQMAIMEKSEYLEYLMEDLDDPFKLNDDPIQRKTQFFLSVNNKYILGMLWYKDYQFSCTHGDDLFIFLIWDDAPIWHDSWIKTLDALLLKPIMKRPNKVNKKYCKYHLY
jgi:hypothetical protein